MPTTLDVILDGELRLNGSSTLEEATADQCRTVLVCPNNETLLAAQQTADEEEDTANGTATGGETHYRLRFLKGPGTWWIDQSAALFEAQFPPGSVKLDFVEQGFAKLFEDIINEAQSQTGLYDGFLTPPSIAGNVVPYNGWQDLTPFIQESPERLEDWSDVLLGYRKYIAQYEGKIIMFPLDGDILSLYYRKDVFQAFNLTVPRTWEEYGQVSAKLHGKTFQNQTLIGSCIGRMPGCAGTYWANLLISSMTQTQGQHSGHLLDPTNMQPLTGQAIEQALQWMETQVEYGAEDEFGGCIRVNMKTMEDGQCAMTYNWGNQFKEYLKEDSTLRGKFGVAPTPGSKQVLDRTTNALVDCDEETCRYGTNYPDIGWVNHAPYLAFGGWGCSVNNYANNPQRQRLATEFCAFAASREGSLERVVTNSSGPFSGQDPFRESHLDEDFYLQQGYESDTSQQYIDAIRQGIDSSNVVTDIRFPSSSDIHAVLDREFFEYLNKTKHNVIPMEDRAKERVAISERITREWQEIITEHDLEAVRTSQYTAKEAYQRLRDVYVNNIDLNQLGNVRYFGFCIAGVLISLSVAFAVWSIVLSNTRVVRASQPFFLIMICFGTLTLAVAIVLMSIDDEIATDESCSRVCMAIPWFVCMGWVIVFSALHSKLRRVNLVFANAQKFRRLKVDAKDVLYVFLAFFVLNFVLLLLWSTLDPATWKRDLHGELDSIGRCHWNMESATSKAVVSLLGIVNLLALVFANWEAFKARKVSTEYGESKYIGLAMASILQALLIGLPLIILVEDNPSAEFFISATFVFIVAMAILCLIFVPKIYASRNSRNQPKSSGRKSDGKHGLAYRVVNTDVFAKEVARSEYEKKIADLTAVLTAEGLDTDDLYRRAGLNTAGSSLFNRNSSQFLPSRFTESKMESPAEKGDRSETVSRLSFSQAVPEKMEGSANNDPS